MMDLWDRCVNDEQRKYLTVYFCSGARLREALTLKPEQFAINNYAIVINNVMVEKHFDYLKDDAGQKLRNTDPRLKRKYVTKTRKVVRRIRIPRGRNPLAEPLVTFVEECEDDYLLPAIARHGGCSREAPASKSYAYGVIHSIDDRIWPHWIRSQTAQYLIEVLKLSSFQITNWFKWSSADIASRYLVESDSEWSKAMNVPQWPT